MSLTQEKKPWEEKAQPARTKRDDSLLRVQPALADLPDQLPQNSQSLAKSSLTARELDITEGYSVSELLAKLHSRELSAEEVVKAFLRRAALAHFAVCLSLSVPLGDGLTKPDQLSH